MSASSIRNSPHSKRWQNRWTFRRPFHLLGTAAARFRGLNKIARDITERKWAEEALNEQSKVLDLAQVLVRDLDGRIVQWNGGSEKLYGYASEESMGKLSHDLLHAVPEPLSEIERKLYETGVWEGELVHRKRNGSRLVVASVWVLHRNAVGLPIRVLEANADVVHTQRSGGAPYGASRGTSSPGGELARRDKRQSRKP